MKALLLYPEFSALGFWNYGEVCRLMGAKYPASPLGMITMAALLPAEWELRLIDMNTRGLDDRDIDWADLVFIGGMLPQQSRFLRLIERVHSRGKKVVAGGPDPTSQPHVYQSADYLVLGEAEASMGPFLQDLWRGVPSGTYVPSERPDIAMSPVPRFDLLDRGSYLMMGVQVSRGCPFTCEFCDIIELYGRHPRVKTPEQVVRELEALRAAGHRGHVDFVDDNFVGNKAKAKLVLEAVAQWSREHRNPFYFSTEASANLADDEDLLRLMRELDFRYVFIGIESADETVLAAAKKRQNLRRNVIEDLHEIYNHGMIVNGGFILGFDDETSESARRMVEIIDRGSIVMPMVGLLFALPNTQLTRRLERENRLLAGNGRLKSASEATEVDQTTTGLNFETRRPRAEVLGDFLHVLSSAYATRSYFDRCLDLARALRVSPRFRPTLGLRVKYAIGFLKTVMKLGLRPRTAYYYWRNLVAILLTRISAVETLINLMAMYLHFRTQTEFASRMVRQSLLALRTDVPCDAWAANDVRPVESRTRQG